MSCKGCGQYQCFLQPHSLSQSSQLISCVIFICFVFTETFDSHDNQKAQQLATLRQIKSIPCSSNVWIQAQIVQVQRKAAPETDGDELVILLYREGVNSIPPGYLGYNFLYTPALEKKYKYTASRQDELENMPLLSSVLLHYFSILPVIFMFSWVSQKKKSEFCFFWDTLMFSSVR